MAATRKRLENMRRDPHVSLTVLGKDDWYHQVTLRGGWSRSPTTRPVRHRPPVPPLHGRDYSARDDPRVNAWIEIDSGTVAALLVG